MQSLFPSKIENQTESIGFRRMSPPPPPQGEGRGEVQKSIHSLPNAHYTRFQHSEYAPSC